MSPSPNRRRRAGRTLAVVAVSLLALAGCSSAQREPSSYSGAEDNFIEGCETVAKQDNKTGGETEISSPKTYCQCVFDAISDKETGVEFSRFKEINADLRQNGGPLPKDFQKAYDSCKP